MEYRDFFHYGDISMKKITKITAVFAALVLALAFVACSEEDDPSVVSEWVGTYSGSEISMTFFDDGTAVMGADNGNSLTCSYTSTLGTTQVGSVITVTSSNGFSEKTTIYLAANGNLCFYLDGAYLYKK